MQEITRVTKSGGKFFCNPYGKRHTSFTSGQTGEDGLVTAIKRGSLMGCGQICFYDEAEARALVEGWTIESLQEVEITDRAQLDPLVHAEWRLIVEKP